jgi:hypothetical protein
MDEGEIGYHHAKCLGPIHPAKNLSPNSFQFIGDLVGQWKHECGVDSLKWNVQPLIVVKRKKLRLSGVAFETHDDVLSEGVLSPDFEHSKKLAEMALGKFGIDGKPELSARLCGSNDSALRSGCGFFCSGHVISSLGYILQHMYMRLEDHALTDCNQKGSRGRNVAGVVGLLHDEGGKPNGPQQIEP